jgi:amino acid permease
MSPSRAALLGGGARGSKPDMGDMRFALISSAIIILSYAVAMTVSSLSTVLAYVGSTGSTSISFILPGLFYYKISSPDSPLHQKLMKEDDDEAEGGEREGLLGGSGGEGSGPMASWRRGLTRKLSLALAIYGIVVMITCLVTNTMFVAAH